MRRSGESNHSQAEAGRSRRTSTTQSRRSSFALERASFEANRSSLEAFGVQAAARRSAPALQPVRRLLVASRAVHAPARSTVPWRRTREQPGCIGMVGAAREPPPLFACMVRGDHLQYCGTSIAEVTGLWAACQDVLELGEAVDPEQLCQQLNIQEALRPRVLALALVPPDTPLPMSMLAMLWRLGSLSDAEATANLLEGQARRSPCCSMGKPRQFLCPAKKRLRGPDALLCRWPTSQVHSYIVQAMHACS